MLGHTSARLGPKSVRAVSTASGGSAVCRLNSRGMTARSMHSVIVRDGVLADLSQVAALKVRSWDDTYRPLVGDAVMDQLLDVEEHRKTIQEDLGKHEAFLLVAEAPDGEILGFALSCLDDGGE